MAEDVEGKEWHWALFSANGRMLAMNADGYSSADKCREAIKAIKRLADKLPEAPIVRKD